MWPIRQLAQARLPVRASDIRFVFAGEGEIVTERELWSKVNVFSKHAKEIQVATNRL